MDRKGVLEILRQNVGFDSPERWVDYALEHAFQRVHAVPITECPDCGSSPRHELGQYVYYSTLIRLRECANCRLIWADAKLPPSVVGRHFDRAYKDDLYFVKSRRLVFSHMAKLIDQLTPPGARILDVGGAKGHLMHQVRTRRPDVRIVVNDISEEATRAASEKFGFDTICGDAHALAHHDGTYDLVVLSDVLYYIADIAAFWVIVSRLLAPGGVLVIRVPNKVASIRLCRSLKLAGQAVGVHVGLEDHVPCFNPEHIYVFSRHYLQRRLKTLGFEIVQVTPSPSICRGSRLADAVVAGTFGVLTAVSRLSWGWATLSPSMVVVGLHGTQRRPGSVAGVLERR
jgi:predicted TPR repeat methyltransferase